MNILNNIFSKKYFKSILKRYFFELFTLTGFVAISLFMLSGQVKVKSNLTLINLFYSTATLGFIKSF
jgi:hypothetical protein